MQVLLDFSSLVCMREPGPPSLLLHSEIVKHCAQQCLCQTIQPAVFSTLEISLRRYRMRCREFPYSESLPIQGFKRLPSCPWKSMVLDGAGLVCWAAAQQCVISRAMVFCISSYTKELDSLEKHLLKRFLCQPLDHRFWPWSARPVTGSRFGGGPFWTLFTCQLPEVTCSY